ncbi:winged helix-turn-helix transcriptional regulator [Longitalea luteola]|uniref:winged helix-turn-helix transcriptional regulator n=1 Tax=Longitalea luteola TaxID=2812563 RepID=UPI001A978DF1|nr:helix-turn-helix domain-containing protein [Longitalea luteola]
MTRIKESSSRNENKKALAGECMEIYAANIIGGQWTLAICCHLINGKLRFGELKKRLPWITERMLALQLKKMEKNNLVKRTVFAEVPLRVEYELTESGKGLEPVLKLLEEWGIKHLKTMNN